MSEDSDAAANVTTTVPSQSLSNESVSKTQLAIQSLSSILTTAPPSLFSSINSAFSLLHDHEISSQISALLRQPDSGAGDNDLCRWFYDTFQSDYPHLQLVVLRFLPAIAGLYLSRISLRKPLAGFEAVLLALYAHETTSRDNQSITVSIPDLSHPSIYHESREHAKNNSTELNLGVISPALEPHGTVRSTRRARIVGVALELYYSKIDIMPVESKIEFCEFCEVWSGQDGEMYKELGGVVVENGENQETVKRDGRIPLPWELLQPVLRILGHCILGPKKDDKLFDSAFSACRSLYARSLHDINPKAILAFRSLLRLINTSLDPKSAVDYTEPSFSNVITI
ncbi:hypothetical protein K2173_014188 [Erythroxylum novogranatense]|uniref:Hyccin n=1 Tax=Erythroxylum novogranatense TaxID=1862640 RepID=A0AAV8SE32_9ROSI|nr:hypothetical protein K2173_014188 [Erythroxylum novogranatense]